MNLFRKPRLPGKLVMFAYRFIDVGASGETSRPHQRLIEYGFVVGRMGQANGEKRALDVGCASSINCLPAILTSLGWEVWGIDTREWKFKFPGFHFIQGDIRHTSFPDKFFDVVYAVSSIEHAGITGRYGITEKDLEGDLKAVNEIKRILKKEGKFLVTTLYGRKQRISLERVYDQESIERLFRGWKIEEKLIFSQDKDGTPYIEEELFKEGFILLELKPL